MSYKQIAPNVSEIKTGTPAIKIGEKYVVGGIGGNFIPGRLISTGGVNTSDATATEADILYGKTAYVVNGKVTGTIGASTPTVTENDVTIPKGYIEEERTITVGNAVNGSQIRPSTTEQTINAGSFLLGDVVIEGSESLVAKNISAGESIFGVSGTFTSDATATAADIAKDKTAYVNGEKIVGTATGGGGSSGTILYMPMNGSLDIYGDLKYALSKGKAYSEMDMGEVDWTPEFAEGVFSEEQALSFVKGPVDDEGYPLEPPYYKYVDLPISEKFFLGDFTWDFWVYADSSYDISYEQSYLLPFSKNGIGFKTVQKFERIILSLPGYTGGQAGKTIEGYVTQNAWNHVASVKKDGVIEIYINGDKRDEEAFNPTEITSAYRDMFLAIGNKGGESVFKINHLRILNHALWTENFTPPTKESYATYMA